MPNSPTSFNPFCLIKRFKRLEPLERLEQSERSENGMLAASLVSPGCGPFAKGYWKDRSLRDVFTDAYQIRGSRRDHRSRAVRYYAQLNERSAFGAEPSR